MKKSVSLFLVSLLFVSIFFVSFVSANFLGSWFEKSPNSENTNSNSITGFWSWTRPTQTYCGDGRINVAGEQCDRTNLGGKTCQTQGFSGGTLSCDLNNCRFVTNECTANSATVQKTCEQTKTLTRRTIGENQCGSEETQTTLRSSYRSCSGPVYRRVCRNYYDYSCTKTTTTECSATAACPTGTIQKSSVDCPPDAARINQTTPESGPTTTQQFLQGMGAISWYKMEGDAKDSIKNNSGPVQGGVTFGVTFVSGKYGNAANFDGINDYIDISANPVKLKYNNFTISFWLKKSNARFENILAYAKGGGSGTIDINRNPNKIRFESFTNNKYQPESVSTGINVSDVEWHNFAIVSSPTEFALYTDGIKSYSTTPNTDTANQIFRYIGNQQSQPSYGNWLSGQMDELIFFNNSLSASQIRSVYSTLGQIITICTDLKLNDVFSATGTISLGRVKCALSSDPIASDPINTLLSNTSLSLCPISETFGDYTVKIVSGSVSGTPGTNAEYSAVVEVTDNSKGTSENKTISRSDSGTSNEKIINGLKITLESIESTVSIHAGLRREYSWKVSTINIGNSTSYWLDQVIFRDVVNNYGYGVNFISRRIGVVSLFSENYDVKISGDNFVTITSRAPNDFDSLCKKI